MTAPAGGDLRENPMRWGVLSTANIGAGRVIPAIVASSNGRLAGVASRDLARAERLAARYPGARAFGSYDALLADPEIEAVYIPLPNQLHAEWTIRAAQAGKHVLCEKPLAGSPEDVRRMIAACRDAGVLLLEAFMYRFHPQIRWALGQIAAGAIGAVRLVRGAFSFDIAGRPNDVRLSAALAGGSLMDVGCYPLNFCRAVYGGPPVAAAARVIVPPGSEVERTTAAVLDFGQDRLGVIDCSFDQPEYQFAEVVGERGRLVLPRPFTPFLTEPVVRIERGDETVERRFAAVDQYRLEVEHVAECIRTGSQPALTPADALEQAESIELIYSAAGYQRPW
jgi:predicted dehydrogenase